MLDLDGSQFFRAITLQQIKLLSRDDCLEKDGQAIFLKLGQVEEFRQKVELLQSQIRHLKVQEERKKKLQIQMISFKPRKKQIEHMSISSLFENTAAKIQRQSSTNEPRISVQDSQICAIKPSLSIPSLSTNKLQPLIIESQKEQIIVDRTQQTLANEKQINKIKLQPYTRHEHQNQNCSFIKKVKSFLGIFFTPSLSQRPQNLAIMAKMEEQEQLVPLVGYSLQKSRKKSQ